MIRLELNGWEAHIGFSASHILPEHDKCGRLHGHNYAVHARIEGEETEEGFVLDFLPLKKGLRKIADELDHRMLLAKDLGSWEDDSEEVEIELNGKRYVFPREDVKFIDAEHTTTEQLSRYVMERVQEVIDLPDNIHALEIGVDESHGQGAWVRREL